MFNFWLNLDNGCSFTSPNHRKGYALERTLPPKTIESAAGFAMAGQPVGTPGFTRNPLPWEADREQPRFLSLSFLCLAPSALFHWYQQEQLLKPLMAMYFWKRDCRGSQICSKRFLLALTRWGNVPANTLTSLQVKVRLLRKEDVYIFSVYLSLFPWGCVHRLSHHPETVLKKHCQLRLLSSFFSLQ